MSDDDGPYLLTITITEHLTPAQYEDPALRADVEASAFDGLRKQLVHLGEWPVDTVIEEWLAPGWVEAEYEDDDDEYFEHWRRRVWTTVPRTIVAGANVKIEYTPAEADDDD